ncbi:MAG: tRNA pseudouridine(38-40) synthase TruA, partial [Candidatus Omnitrophica bacterium]|nr:tRNA pseudouridine(38-40) synthase TruA [Candidatus Omnitrophota bacterium]
DSVFWRNFAWHFPAPLDLRKMRKVSKKLIGRKDFSLFTKKAKNYKDCKRKIKDIVIRKRSDLISIDIEADGFLRYMARNIISFLVRVADGSISLESAPFILKGKISYTNRPAPPGGLYLYKIIY